MDEFLKVLREALLKGGLTEGSEEFTGILKPENFEGLKEQLNLKVPKTLEEALKLPGVQSDYDKKVTAAVQSREANLKEKWDFIEKGTAPQKETPEQKAIRELQEKNAKYEAEQALSNRKAKAMELLKSKEIPETFINGFDFASEVELDEQFKGIDSQFTEVKQNIINGNMTPSLPLGKGANGEVSDAEAADIVSRM